MYLMLNTFHDDAAMSLDMYLASDVVDGSFAGQCGGRLGDAPTAFRNIRK
jgi:hypothetical protein